MKLQSVICTLLTITCAHASTIISELNVGSTSSTHMNQIGGSVSGAIGTQNSVSTSSSLAVGWSNTLWDDDNENSSLAVGRLNYLEAYAAIVSGYGNQVFNGWSITTGINNVNTERYSLVLGEHNITTSNRHRNGILLGAYNAAVTKAAHVVIGNGTSTGNRKNSFIVYADGDIVITKPQGDISMGAYE